MTRVTQARVRVQPSPPPATPESARTTTGPYRVSHPRGGVDLMAEARVRSAERDRQLMNEGFQALLAQRRGEVVAWARSFLTVGGVSFRGDLSQLRLLHAHSPIAQVALLVEKEREISELRKRLGIAAEG